MSKNVSHYNDVTIENIKDFKYLGIVFFLFFSRSRSFLLKQNNKIYLCEQAQYPMYGAIRKIRQFNLPLDCQIDLFDKIAAPVLLYGCEIWGNGKHNSN